MKKVLLAYNPNSGNASFRDRLDYIVEKMQKKNLIVVVARLESYEYFDKLVSLIKPSEYKKVLIAGGDGTINFVVNTLMKYGINIPIAIFPSGTANDFANCFNLPKSFEDLTRVAMRDNYTEVDLGQANDKYFVNVASVGSLVDISQRTDTWAKGSLGVVTYYLKGVEEFMSMTPTKVTISSPDFEFDGEMFFMVIMNGKTAGGIKNLSPYSEINDGKLDVYIFKKCARIDFMSIGVQLLAGDHGQNKNVEYFKTHELTVSCESGTGTDVDGEKGPEFPIKFSVLPRKLKICSPVK